MKRNIILKKSTYSNLKGNEELNDERDADHDEEGKTYSHTGPGCLASYSDSNTWPLVHGLE